MSRWTMRACLVALLAIGLPTAPAHGRPYSVYSCADPVTGAPLEAGFPRAWRVLEFPAGETNYARVAGCGAPGGSFGASVAPGSGGIPYDGTTPYSGTSRQALVAFHAPPSTHISHFEIWRGARVPGDDRTFAIGTTGHESSSQCCNFEHGPALPSKAAFQLGDPLRPLTEAGRFARDGAFSVFYLVLQCNGTSCPRQADIAFYRVFAARSDIEDPHPPAFAAPPSGGLLTSPASGPQRVDLSATDRGGGLRRAAVLVDGTLAAEHRFDRGDGQCTTDRFVDSVPCPLKADASLEVNADRFSDGPHTVTVRVEDAAGNPAEHVQRGVVFDRRGVPNGSPADERARLSARLRGRRTLRSRVGRRLTLSGRLTTADRRPIAGARLLVQERLRRSGAAFATIATPSTGSDGRYRLRVRARASSTMRVSYTAYSRAARAADGADVGLRVPARARLSVRPRRVRNHRSARFAGRLVHGPFPRGGKVVEIQAREGGRWQVFRTVRTDRRGRFRTSYRFRNSPRPHAIRFRVRVRRDSTYPFELGHSNAVRIVAGG